MTVLPFGPDGWLVECADSAEVHAVAAGVRQRLRDEPPARPVEVVPGWSTVLVVGLPPPYQPADPTELGGRDIELSVAYGGEYGPDLDDVAGAAGLSPGEVVRRHTAGDYTVAFLGFSPGFAYLAGLDPSLHTTRLDTPRTRVPAGSVGIAGGQTGVYPSGSPGGWRLVGRTDAALFDPTREPATLLAAGDRVRLRPVDAVDPPREPTRPSLDDGPVLVRQPGPRTSIQDAGRPGLAHLGVPRGGAVDTASLARANLAVGNPPDAAALELTVAGPRLALDEPVTVALAGASAAGWPDAEPVDVRDELTVGPLRGGVRAYLAFRGGLDTPSVLGSRASEAFAGVGPAPLQAGDRLRLGRPDDASPADVPPPLPGPDQAPIHVHPGPRAEWIAGGLPALLATAWTVSPDSDRTGVRLSMPALGRARRDELPSEGMRPGAIEVPADGQPIVLLASGPTTGGYPVAGVVDPADLPRLGQARPGMRLRFVLAAG